MPHHDLTTEEIQKVAEVESKRLESKIMADVDRFCYDMRHPYWRENLDKFMASRRTKIDSKK